MKQVCAKCLTPRSVLIDGLCPKCSEGLLERETETCHLCGSTDILKYDGECNPVCAKCAGGIHHVSDKEEMRQMPEYADQFTRKERRHGFETMTGSKFTPKKKRRKR